MTKTKMVKNVLAVFDAATPQERMEGMNWYQRAHYHAEHLANKYRIRLPEVAGVIAALSPGRNWDKNLYDAETLIHDFKRGCRGKDLPLVGSYGWGNVLKSERILLGDDPRDVLGGLKVRAFYECILNPWNSKDSAVCIDRHAKSVAMGRRITEKEASIRPAQYRVLAEVYSAAGVQVGVAPHVLQAITWVAWRNLLSGNYGIRSVSNGAGGVNV